MSKLILLFVGLLFAFEFKAQNFKTAVEYNDYIVQQQNLIGTQIIKFNEEMGKEGATATSVQPYYEKLLSINKTAIENVSKMPGFENNVALRDAVLELLKFYERTFSVDYKKIIDLVFSKNLDDAAIGEINRLLEKITSEEKPYDEKFAAAQASFAKQYNFELIENELNEEFEQE